MFGLGAALGRSAWAARALPPSPATAETEADTEYSVKAAFLYNFLGYTTWPKGTFEKEDSPIELLVLGKDPFGDILEDALRGKLIGKRPVKISRAKTLPEKCTANVVFACELDKDEQAEMIGELGKRPVLLIGETPGFAEAGGTINFFLDKARVRFEINAEEAKASGLTLSSQLLKLAKIVKTKQKKGGDGK